jgi:hypothetical protein
MGSVEDSFIPDLQRENNTYEVFENSLIAQNMPAVKLSLDIDAPGSIGGETYHNKGVNIAETGSLETLESLRTRFAPSVEPSLSTFQVSENTSAPDQNARFRDSLNDFFYDNKEKYKYLLDLELLKVPERMLSLEEILTKTMTALYKDRDVETNTFPLQTYKDYINVRSNWRKSIAYTFPAFTHKMQELESTLSAFLKQEWNMDLPQ